MWAAAAASMSRCMACSSMAQKRGSGIRTISAPVDGPPVVGLDRLLPAIVGTVASM
jgi:hypothetical protein